VRTTNLEHPRRRKGLVDLELCELEENLRHRVPAALRTRLSSRALV